MIAGGVESMSRAPFVCPKPTAAFARNVADLRHRPRVAVRQPADEGAYGVDSMGETAENVAERFDISRADQDAFALRSQQRAVAAQAAGRFAEEIVPVPVSAAARRDPVVVDNDEHPRATTPRRRSPSCHAVSQGRHGDGRQCVGRERRRLRAAASRRRRRRAPGLTPRARIGGAAVAGVRAAHDGHRPGAGDPEAAAATGVQSSDRLDRAERSVRGAGAGGHCASWACRTTRRA